MYSQNWEGGGRWKGCGIVARAAENDATLDIFPHMRVRVVLSDVQPRCSIYDRQVAIITMILYKGRSQRDRERHETVETPENKGLRGMSL